MKLVSYQQAKAQLAWLKPAPIAGEIALWCQLITYRTIEGDPPWCIGQTGYKPSKRIAEPPTPTSGVIGLNAYNKLGEPFDYEHHAGRCNPADDPDLKYLSVLEFMYFDRDEIRNFIPATRYLTYRDLGTRWDKKMDNELAFFNARLAQRELRQYNANRFTSSLAPVYSSFYSLPEIEVIEKEYLGGIVNTTASQSTSVTDPVTQQSRTDAVTENAKKAAHARHAPTRKLREFAINLYQKKNYKYVQQGCNDIFQAVLVESKRIGHPLTETTGPTTVYNWLLESNKKKKAK